MPSRRGALVHGTLLASVALVAVALIALPALAASPSASPSPSPAADEATNAWAWAAMAALILGGLAVLAAGRRWGPEAAKSIESTEALLAQYQRLASRSASTAPTDEEIDYQRAVLHDLDPIVATAAVAASDPAAREGLRAVRTAAKDLRSTLRAARGTALGSPERVAVGSAAEMFGRVVHAARHPNDEDEEE